MPCRLGKIEHSLFLAIGLDRRQEIFLKGIDIFQLFRLNNNQLAMKGLMTFLSLTRKSATVQLNNCAILQTTSSNICNPKCDFSIKIILGIARFGGLIIILLTSAIFFEPAEALDYSLQGYLKVRFPAADRGSTSNHAVFHQNFCVHVQNTNWVIIMDAPIETNLFSDHSITGWKVTCFDGKIYTETKFRTAATIKIFNSTNTIKITGSATIDRGLQPMSLGALVSRASVIWLALASDSIITDGKQILRPVWEFPRPGYTRQDVRDFQLQAYVERQQQSPQLPTKVTFKDNNDADTNFTYEVVSWFGKSVLNFPAEFRGHKYEQFPNVGSAVEVMEYQGFVTNAVVDKSPELSMPTFEGSISAEDYSVSTNNEKVIGYVARNGSYRSFTNKADYMRAQNVPATTLMKPAVEVSDLQQYTIRGIIIFMIFFPPLALGWKKYKTKQTTNDKI